MSVVIIVLVLFAPLVPLLFYGRWKAKRKAAALQRDGEKPFAPKPTSAPGRFLSHFAEPERAYLGQQFHLARSCYFVGAWIYLVGLSGSLLPQSVSLYSSQLSLAQRVWYSYLNLTTAGMFPVGISFVAAAIAGLIWRNPAQGGFYRTRPLSRPLLFWGRIGAGVSALLACIVTGIAVSFLLLRLFYGPVWRHLFDQVNPGMTPEQARHLFLVSRTSAPRLFLSLATTTMLTFAFFVALLTEPLRPGDKHPIGKALLWVAGGLIVAIILAPNLARELFLYGRPGPPPPWIFAAIPIALSAALLFLAEKFMEHLEV